MKYAKHIRDAITSRLPSRRKEFSYHFIHIPKNAGNSVRTALKRRGDVSVTKPYHYRYVDIADRVGRHLQFFCIVRNPWGRTASRYVFAMQNAKDWPNDDPRRMYIQQATFADFVNDQRRFEIPEHPGQPWMGPMNSWFNQLEWIRNEVGEVVCDCLRLECLSQDLGDYFGSRIAVSNRNTTRNRYDYRNMYTDDLIEVVARTFKDDIEYFGFDFDGPATRNIAVLK